MVDPVKAVHQGLTPKVLEDSLNCVDSAIKAKRLSVFYGYKPEDMKELAVRWGIFPDADDGLKDEDLPLLHQCFEERKKESSHRSQLSDAKLAIKFCCHKNTIARRRVDYERIDTTNTGT